METPSRIGGTVQVKKSISFSLTDDERDFFIEYAARKGMTISALAKMALFLYEASHCYKGLSLGNYSKQQKKRPDGPAFGE
jgi:hypothetical protein